MRLTNILVRDAIVPDLKVPADGVDPKDPQAVLKVKTEIIKTMIAALHAAGYFQEHELPDIVQAVLRREQLGTTGIGQGVAIPHSRHPSVHELVGTLAIAPKGVPFDSLDNEPVYVIILLISPQDQPREHLRALEAVVRTMRDPAFVERLRHCHTRDEIWNLLEAASPGW